MRRLFGHVHRTNTSGEIHQTCNYWGMRASAGLMRMYELQKVVAALPVDDLRDASALHVQTPGRMRKSLN